MRTIEEIKADERILSSVTLPDGIQGEIHMPLWEGTFICSTGAGWEHVSVVPKQKRIMPSYYDMCTIKDIFWRKDEAVIEVHPAEKDYVNNVENCLHLWKCTYRDMVLPPSILVGMRKDQTIEEARKEIRQAFEMAGEDFEKC